MTVVSLLFYNIGKYSLIKTVNSKSASAFSIYVRGDYIMKKLTFIKGILTGSSLPIVVADERERLYIVKFTGGEGTLSAINEWLAGCIGTFLKLPVLPPSLLYIDDLLLYGDIDPETRQTIQKSSGWNIAFPYYEGVLNKLGEIEDRDAEVLFLYDCFMLNIDRNPLNHNVIRSDSVFFAIDYGTSLLTKGILEDKTYFLNPMVLKQLRRNPLYTNTIKFEKLWNRLEKLPFEQLEKWVHEIPDEWIVPFIISADAGKQQLINGIWEYIQQPAVFKEMLEQLAQIPLETEEERGKI
jgi:hypothetical protein